MAKLSMKLKQSRPAKFSTRAYTRCRICGRPHSVLRKYGVCRVCFRELAYKGEIPGVKKASWEFTRGLDRMSDIRPGANNLFRGGIIIKQMRANLRRLVANADY